MSSRILVAAIVFLAAVLPAAARTNEGVGTHTLIVAVRKNLAPSAEKKLAVLVLVSQHGSAPAGAVAKPGEPLTVIQQNSGLYRVRAEVDSCKGACDARYRILGSADHKLEVVPACRARGSGFVCSSVKIIKVH